MKQLSKNPFKAMIQVADDILAVCADRNAKFNMLRWCDGGHRGRCEVCLAGSIMLKRLGAPRTLSTLPSFYDDGSSVVYGQLCAFSALRWGILDFLECWPANRDICRAWRDNSELQQVLCELPSLKLTEIYPTKRRMRAYAENMRFVAKKMLRKTQQLIRKGELCEFVK